MTPQLPDAPHPADDGAVGALALDYGETASTAASTMATPPHSLEAERECLAAVFLGETVLDELAAIVKPPDFFVERHRVLYATMLAMRGDGAPVDLVSLALALRDRGVYERLGGARAIGELMERTGTVANVAHYARVVRDKARLRRLIETARAIEVAAYQDVADVDAFVRSAESTWDGAMAATRPVATLDTRSIAEAGEQSWLTEPPSPADALLTWGEGTRQPLMMAAGRVALLAAAGGVGKTYALLQLAFAIATGTTWLDTYQVSRKGRVLLALAEEDIDEIRRRVWSAAKVLGKPDDEQVAYLLSEAARNIVPMPLMGRDVALLDRERQASDWHRTMLETLATGPWRALILDPLSRWGGPDIETDAHAATRVVQLLESMTQIESKPALIVAHHTNKGALRDDGEARTQGVVRGHSALVDGVRWVGFLERRPTAEEGMAGKRLRLSVVKSNYGPTPPALDLVRGSGGTIRPMTPLELTAEREASEARKGKRGAA